MRLFQSLVILLAMASTCLAQVKLEQTVVAPYQLWVGFVSPEIQPDGTIKASPNSKPTSKTVQPDPRYTLVLDEGFTLKDLVVESLPSLEFADYTLTPDGNKQDIKIAAGSYRATAKLEYSGKEVTKRFNFTIGKPTPTPDPTPDPDPLPVPGKIDNLAVLIVYESGQLSAYTEAQRNVINSTVLRGWMDNNLPKDAQSLPNWRVLDKDTKFPTNSDIVYKKWLQVPPTKLPYLIIGNKDTIVYQGDLPTDLEQIKAIITKYKK